MKIIVCEEKEAHEKVARLEEEFDIRFTELQF